MFKEVVTARQMINTMVLFIIGSAVVLGAGGQAKEDAWLAVLLAILLSAPMFFIYAKLNTIYPDQDIYDILTTVFGSRIGKLISLVFLSYGFILGALVIRDFCEFIQIVSMPETPKYVISLIIGVFCIYMVRSGFEVSVRWATFFCPMVVILIIVITLLSVPIMDISNLKPTLYNGLKPVLSSSFLVFTFPFAETVVFIAVMNTLRNKQDSYKVYFKSLIVGGFTLLLATTRNILVLGVEYASSLYFPSYSAASVINIADFLQRIEVLVALNFILAGIIKISICLFAACKGVAKIFNIKDYRPLAAPIGFLMINTSLVLYNSIMKLVDWAVEIYPYYAIPFQIMIPILVLIAALIKSKLTQSSKM